MDLTTSNSYVTDTGTGQRMHLQSQATPTAVSDTDLNGLTWEAVAVIKAAGLTPTAFDKTLPVTYTQVRDAIAILLRQQTNTAFTTSGTAPNYVLTPTLPITVYAIHLRYRVSFNAAGSGANSINVSALGAKLLKQYDSSGAKITAVIAASQLADVEYDGVDFVVLDPLPMSSQLPGEVCYFARNTAPVGFLKANGAAISVAAYPALTTAIYCGDASNPTALFGYRCNNTDGSGRSITGTYIILPDIRGEFIRGWDDARGIDAGRAFGSWQADDFKSHTHNPSSGTLFLGNATGGGITTGGGLANYVSAVNTGGTETRPRNIAQLACIKY